MKAFFLLCLSFFPILNALSQGSTYKFKIQENWEFKQAGEEEWLPVSIPGTVHTDLLKHKKIPNPFYRNNEEEVQWIEQKDWEYRTTFDIPNILEHKHIDLNFEGLDTYADVYLNGQQILTADNMFREWKIPVKEYLKKMDNELRIYFHSPIKKALPLLEALPYELPAGNDAAEKKVSVFTRKAPYSYGWDWGPRMVTSGIWRPVYFTVWEDAKITDFYVEQQKLTDSLAKLKAHFTIHSELEQTAFTKVKVTGTYSFTEQKIQLKKGTHTYSVDVQIDQPKRWWSNGLGTPHLYKIEASVLDEASQEIGTVKTKIGLRTIELIQEPDSIGTSYYFKLNGKPVFMKGANYIPASSFVPDVSKRRYKEIIQSAVDANMNMLRVWGGGIYENDYFYDLCDEKGILVWQDFMFACSMYPDDNDFLENVKHEVEDNVKRLRQHPSIALWCGNNEVNVAWFNWGWQKQFGYSKKDSIKIRNDYINLFQELIPETLATLDKRPYVHTSPLSNWGTAENFNHSSMHYWGVWHGEDPFSEFKNNVGRFNSEYGFQSFPELSTIKKIALEEERHLDSDVLQKRQKSYKGNRLLFDYIYRSYKKEKDFNSFLYLNQLTQAEGIKFAIEQHRKKMPHCMGTLYWQLNDCWPAISWSSTDYYGKWKALHYFVREAYKPILIVPELDKTQLNVTIVSDKLENTTGTLGITLLNFAGDTVAVNKQNIELTANQSQVYFDENIKKWLAKKGKLNKDELVFTFLFETFEGIVAKNTLYFNAPKELNLNKPQIQKKVRRTKGGYNIELSTDYLAKNVYLSSDISGFFSDNYFDLYPNQVVQIFFKTNMVIDQIENYLEISSLIDSHQ